MQINIISLLILAYLLKLKFNQILLILIVIIQNSVNIN